MASGFRSRQCLDSDGGRSGDWDATFHRAKVRDGLVTDGFAIGLNTGQSGKTVLKPFQVSIVATAAQNETS